MHDRLRTPSLRAAPTLRNHRLLHLEVFLVNDTQERVGGRRSPPKPLNLPQVLLTHLLDHHRPSHQIQIIRLGSSSILDFQLLFDLQVLTPIPLLHNFVNNLTPHPGLPMQDILRGQGALLHFLEFEAQENELIQEYIMRLQNTIQIRFQLRRLGGFRALAPDIQEGRRFDYGALFLVVEG